MLLVTLSNFYDVSMTIYWDWQIFLMKFALENNFKEVLYVLEKLYNLCDGLNFYKYYRLV